MLQLQPKENVCQTVQMSTFALGVITIIGIVLALGFFVCFFALVIVLCR